MTRNYLSLRNRKIRVINGILFSIGSFVNDSISFDEFVNRILLVLKSNYFDFINLEDKIND